MTKPRLYYVDLSPPTRSVKLIIAELGLDCDYTSVNTLAGEQLKPEFVKLNPQHTVPTLDDNGQVIWDSHAICTYLIGKYAKNDKLYPKDIYIRAKIDQRLHYDSGVLFPRFGALVGPVFFGGVKQFIPDAVEKVRAVYDMLETFLTTDTYMVGNSITVADFCCITTITSLVSMIPLDDKHKNVQAWIDRMSKLPYFAEVNTKYSSVIGKMVTEKFASYAA